MVCAVLCMVWCGVISCVQYDVCALVWCGVVRCGEMWLDVMSYGVIWCGVVCGVVWCGVVCGVVWCCVVLCLCYFVNLSYSVKY